jgi:hypothetical protein
MESNPLSQARSGANNCICSIALAFKLPISAFEGS